MLVMCYNRVPSFSDYWSHNTSMGNVAIKRAISRDRCEVLLSKLYFEFLEKPDTAGKLYYLEPIVAYLKDTFQKARSKSTVQSIDESLVKFKGRSALKQYLPMKPEKRVIDMWMRSDSVTGYTYDFNTYCGKDANNLDGTLGERVVLQLSKTIRDVNLLVHVWLTGKICQSQQRNLLEGECEFLCNSSGTLWCKWQDTKEVMLVTNCHSNDVCTVNRKAKDGSKLVVDCPVALKSFNDYMGGVDLAEQMSALYDLARKSDKWWKKAFYKLLLTSVVNAWILQNEIQHKTVPLKHFLVNLAEQMIAKGQKTAKVQEKSSTGRPSKRARVMQNVGLHLPEEGPTRRSDRYCCWVLVGQRLSHSVTLVGHPCSTQYDYWDTSVPGPNCRKRKENELSHTRLLFTFYIRKATLRSYTK
ncbi:piggyBac transposable element-derived protein 4-like [Schistocerca nitens]|uniref:piggyBac transposable element-derived protein 4-like n=1 Tax=Schistocerca nitens TaxID=7011 RepID=UPI00211734F5|nr:piggyBac transposable element-derived protein 4-like [Schistocerca nitens]